MSGGYVQFFRKVIPKRDDTLAVESDSPDEAQSSGSDTRTETLNAYLECDAIDEYNFQVQAALLSTKVLKLLEQQDIMNERTASKLRHFSRSSASNSFMQMASPIFSMSSPTSSGLFPTVARTRSSSWLSTQSIRGIARSPTASLADGPLLDKILDAHTSSNPVPIHEIIKMMNLLTNLHSYCPETNSIGAPMGATCTVSDYTQVIASPEAMTRLVVLIREMLEEKAPTPLIPATIPPGGRLVVCGDTHAQLQDLMWVLFKNGVPSPSNVYVFNGDICDRGGHAVEIFMILFLFKLNWYNSVHIVRGNHEDDYCNIYYGFLAELKHKFGPLPGGIMHSEFLRLFYSLPLSCVIDNWVGLYRCNVTGALIELSLAGTEGGSSPSMGSPKTSTGTEVILRRKDATTGHRAMVKNDQLIFDTRAATRFLNAEGANTLRWGSANDTWEYVSPRILVLHGGIPVPPASSPSNSVLLKHFRDLPHRMKIPPAPKTVLEQWMYQILWSDPAEDGGPKGRGTPFFTQHTQAFTDANNLAAVIRAHQVPSNQRGVSFHHRQKLITIFTASNYCGTSQNYGGVAVFTPTLFPALAINRTLFEHWAPPLSVIRDVLAKHQNATQDVRLFIAHEIETERAPTERASAGSLSHLEQKVGEYVASLIVHNKRQLWSGLNARPRTSRSHRFAIHISDWADVCSKIIGHHFPWESILEQLEIDLVDEDSIDFVSFLHRFKANVRFGETLVDTWDSAVVRGFFYELVAKDLVIQKALVDETQDGPYIPADKLRGIIASACPSISGAQSNIFVQTLLESAPPAAGADMIEVRAVFQAMSEYVRSYFSLLDAAPDSVPSEAVVQTGRDAIEFFIALREAITKRYPNAYDPIHMYFSSVVANNTSVLSVPVMEAGSRVEASLSSLGLDRFKATALNCLYFVASDENEIGDSGDIELSLLRFHAACHIDGTSQGELLKARIAEHATAAVYFHRNALRCACVHLDKTRCGQIDRHAFQRALLALNASLELEWKLSKHQLRCLIEYLRWSEAEPDTPEQLARSVEDEDKLLVIEYDVFLEYVS